MNLKQSYEFLRLMVEGEIETWEARDRATGKRVLVHLLLAGDAAANKKDVERISDLCKQNHELIAVGLDAEIPFVVTGTAFGSVGLRDWSRIAESAAMPTQVWQRGARPSPSNPGAAPPPSSNTGLGTGPQRPPAELGLTNPGEMNAGSVPKHAAEGEFTRLFQSPAKPGGEQWISRPKDGEAPVQGAGPGEFTRILQAPEQRGRPTEAGNRTQGASEQQQNRAVAQPQQPGEFTRFFQSPYASPVPAKTESEQASEPGGAEDLFRQQTSSSPAPSQGPASLASRPPASPAGSEFTQVFQRSSAALPTNPELKSFGQLAGPAKEPPIPARAPAAEPEVKPPSPPSAGDFTRIFNPGPRSIPDSAQRIEQRVEQKAEPPRATLPYALPSVAPPSVAPVPATGAGDYTRVVGTPQAPKIQPPVVTPPKEVQAMTAASVKLKAKTPAAPLSLLAVLFGLLLLAVLIVVFFAIRR